MITRPCMKYDDLIRLAQLWLEIGGRPEVELAALEPTLWHDKNLELADVVQGLKSLTTRDGQPLTVTMTTNGARLAKHAVRLAEAGIDKVRISWHSCDPQVFADIAGVDCYAEFMRGLDAAMAANLPISINRILFKNHLDDLPLQLNYIQRHDLTLKLYDLYWTPAVAASYQDYYQGYDEVVEKYILPRTAEIHEQKFEMVRSRKEFRLEGGGRVVIKEDAAVSHAEGPCTSCHFREQCLEGYCDYLRIDADLTSFPCYLRRDLSIDLKEFLQDKNAASRMVESLETRLQVNPAILLQETKLRYILVPFCNFNCCLPGSEVPFCLKKPGNYCYPRRYAMPICNA